MIKELIVHLGDTKTGSTSIQKVLKQKTYKTAGEELCYPTQNHHNALVRTLTRKRHLPQREVRFGSVYNRFSKSNAALGIVSAEHFQFADPILFEKTARQYWPDLCENMRLIAYIRPHHEKLLSSYSERVKLGIVSGSFDNFVEEVFESKLLDYMPRLKAWRDVFGERFVAKPFVRSEFYKNDVVEDFFKFSLGHENFTISGTASSNTSLTLPQLSLLRLAHLVLDGHRPSTEPKKNPAFFDARSSFGRSISEHINARKLGENGAKLRLPDVFVERVKTRYSKDANALDETFFGGNAMSTALESCGTKATRESQSMEVGDYFNRETIEAFSATTEIMAKMLVKNPRRFAKMVSATRLMFE